MKTLFTALFLFLSALAVPTAAIPLSSSVNLDAGATSAVSDHISIAKSNLWSMLARAPTTIKAEVTFTGARPTVTDDKLPSDTEVHDGVKAFLGLCAPRLPVNSAGSTEVEVSRWNKSPALSQKGDYYEFKVTFNDGSLSGMYTGRIKKGDFLNFKQYGKQALAGRLIDPQGKVVDIKYGELRPKITDNFGEGQTKAKSSKNVMFSSGEPTEYKYDKPSPEPEPELPTPPASEKKKKKKKKTKTDGNE